MEHVLGVNAYGHDPAVALVTPREVRFFLEEERCCRVKHAPGRFPTLALQEALRFLRLSPHDISHAAYPFDARHYFVNRCIRHGILAGRAHAARRTAALSLRRLGLARELREELGQGTLPAPRFLDHHLCHAASAFFASPFEEAAVLTVDGAGEDATIAVHRGHGTRLETLHRIRYPHSLGAFYSSIALHVGFAGGSPEGKLMGLAAHGKPVHLTRFRELISMPDEGDLRVDLDYFDYPGMRRGTSPRFWAEFGPPRKPEQPLTDHDRDLAASAQARLEEVMLALARDALNRTGLRNLCLAGGVALNSVANSTVATHSGCRDLFVVPAAHDAGAALGAAYLMAAELPGFDRDGMRLPRATLGSFVDADGVDTWLKTHGIEAARVEDLPSAVADDIAKGRIVGLYHGRDEAGPRALGHRSILANPTEASTRDHLNRNVKHREPFRPFAPLLREEDLPAYFGQAPPSPFMLLTASATDLARRRIPAALHVDGTARLQTVGRHDHPLLWKLLGEVGTRIGVPVMINTSFNDRGEPLVHTPEDAYRCFRRIPIDILYLGPYRIDRTSPAAEPAIPTHAPSGRTRFDPLDQ